MPHDRRPSQDSRLDVEELALALQHVVKVGVPVAHRRPSNTAVLVPLLHHPAETGDWNFRDQDASAGAVQSFGNQKGFSTEGAASPNARQIFRIRASTQYFFNKGVLQKLLPPEWGFHDPTYGIELIWTAAPHGPADRKRKRSTEKGEEDEDDEDPNADLAYLFTPPPETFNFGTDPISGLRHAPLNGGENDQRGLQTESIYHTRMFGDKTITIDRARALHAKTNQKHKLWIWKGSWIHYSTPVDWNSKASMDNLNKWRNQTLERAGWAATRPLRKEYTEEQRTYLFNVIVQASGKAPTEGYEKVTEEFNYHFRLEGEAKREVVGVRRMCQRLIIEFEENDGQQKAKRRKSKVVAAKADSVMEAEHEP